MCDVSPSAVHLSVRRCQCWAQRADVVGPVVYMVFVTTRHGVPVVTRGVYATCRQVRTSCRRSTTVPMLFGPAGAHVAIHKTQNTKHKTRKWSSVGHTFSKAHSWRSVRHLI